MMRPRVYLAGAIHGQPDSVCRLWRQEARAQLAGEALNPMDLDYRGLESEPAVIRAIVERDKAAIYGADVVLVNYQGPSVGTSMEMLYAWESRVPVVVVCHPDAPLSPWLIYHATAFFPSLAEAVKAINEGRFWPRT